MADCRSALNMEGGDRLVKKRIENQLMRREADRFDERKLTVDFGHEIKKMIAPGADKRTKNDARALHFLQKQVVGV